MLSYQHAFHAGNHADILKHYVLSYTLLSLNKKDKPYTFFDTHSASGLYDLLDNRSQKTLEAKKGIIKILEESEKEIPNSSLCFNEYISFVKKLYLNKQYPGSPCIEHNFLRESDFLILSELHPKEYELLKENIDNFQTEKKINVQVHKRNGFEMLKALTPPKTKRGGVLIDPSYEELSDYLEVADTVKSVFKKWTNGIFLIWYPLLANKKEQINQLIKEIISYVKNINANTEVLNLTLCVDSEDSHVEVDLETVLNDIDKKNPPRLYGSGMLVINAPWQLKEDSQILLKLLENKLQNKK